MNETTCSLTTGSVMKQRFLPIVVALPLLLAASLKAYALWLDPIANTSWLDSRLVQIFFILVELIIGGRLLVGWSSVTLWLSALLLYSVFLVYSFSLGITGASSCGCFGKIEINPWITLGIDGIALFLLWSYRQSFMNALSERKLPLHIIRQPVALSLCSLLVLSVGVMAQFMVRPSADLFANTLIEPSEHDFGLASQMEELQHDFYFVNHLDVPVTISHTHSSCGCTTAPEINGQLLQPRSKFAIPVKMKTGSSEGKKNGVITVFFKAANQPQSAWQLCQVKCQVRIDYSISTDWIDFGIITENTRGQRSLRFRPESYKAAKIMAVETIDPRFRVSRQAEPDGTETLSITFHPDNVLRKETITSLLTIKTNSQRVPAKAIVLRATTMPQEEIDTREIVIGSDVTGTVRKTITLRSSRSKQFRIQCSNPSIHCNVRSGIVQGERTIDVQVDESTSPQGVNTSLELVWLEDDATQAGRRVVIPIHRLPYTKVAAP